MMVEGQPHRPASGHVDELAQGSLARSAGWQAEIAKKFSHDSD